MKTLIYVGAHQGNSLANFVNLYNKIYAFEANPHFCKILKQRFQNNSNVEIINAAICEKHNDFLEFNISKNNGDSSSILEANPDNELYFDIIAKEKVKVPTVNLCNFFNEKNIDYVDSYISDIQGYDLIVLKTLKPYIEAGKINSIQCEVEKNDKISIYKNTDIENTNKEKNFDLFLKDRYKKVASGWGYLENGKLEDVPDNWCEYDVKWELKKNLVLITSVINVNSNIDSVYTSEQRLNQTIQLTINSIKEKIPNPYIVVLEGSKISKDDVLKFKNSKINELVYIDIAGLNKSYGELTLISEYLNSESFKKLTAVDTISKISGRYYLTDNFIFDDAIYKINKITKNTWTNKSLCNTRYYKFPIEHCEIFKDKIKYLLNNKKINIDIEHSFYEYDILPMNLIENDNKIHLKGNLAPDGTEISD